MATEYKLSYTANEINTKLGKIDSLAEKSEIPTKTSDLTNNSGFITSYTETDPTVPAWAKAANKPSYTASEVGADAVGTAVNAISAHNTSTNAHADIREEISDLSATKADKSQGVFYIEGDSSSTTDTTNKVATWIGSHDEITEYFSGLTILYKVVTAGSTTTTLNINNLGAVAVVRNATTGISTSCPVNGVLLLTYTVDSDGTAYWKTADYDANTKNTAGTSNKTGTKLFLVGGASQSSSGVTTYSNSNIYINTSNQLYSAQGFSGNLTGNANTATKASQDASGNVIADTYETKEDADAKFRQLSSEIVNKLEPADDDIPKVFLTGNEFSNMTKDKNEVNMEMEYRSRTQQFHAYVGIKYQGTSSLSYDKKNFTVKLFNDEAHENKQKHLFRDWKHAKHKFVLKANYIDHSHARNIVCANLWNEVVSSRSDYNTLPEELRNSPKNGAVDGFPVKLYVNGTYQGVYTWNIGKDDWMWGMDEDNANHILLCAEYNTNGVYEENACNFRKVWNGLDGSRYSIEVGTNSDALKTSLNNFITFVMNNNGNAFKTGIGTYLDVQSAIDYYIHQYVICGMDGLAKNMLLGTYDGTKWYFGAYDMDSTFGLYWNGSRFVSAEYKCPEDYQEKFNLLWERLEENYWTELKARYAELRKTVYSVGNMFTHFECFMDTIGLDLYAEDLEIYAGIPNGSANNIKQLRSYICDRLVYCDGQILNGVPATSITLNKTSLTLNTEAETLTATVLPSNATDDILWLTSDTSVATVVNGRVTPIAEGNCTIRAKCGSGYGVCEVTVSTEVTPDEPETPDYTNLVSSSIDATGAIFNGTGYQDFARINSQGEVVDSGNTAITATGFIKVSGSDIVRVKGGDFNRSIEGGENGNAIAVYDSGKKHLGTATAGGSVYGIFGNTYGAYKFDSIVEEPEGVYKWVVPPIESGVEWIRLSCISTIGNFVPPGANLIVTIEEGSGGVDEPDVPDVNYTNLVPTAIDTNGSIFNGTGYKYNTRVSSSGVIKESVYEETVCVGYLPAKSGDIFRLKNMLLWDTSIASKLASDCAIALYDSSFNNLGVACFQDTNNYTTYSKYGIFSTSNLATPIKSVDNGITTIEIPNVSSVAYVVISGRITFGETGSDVIITKNEEITAL